MSRRIIPIVIVLGVAGLTTVAFAGSRAVRGHGFHHFHAHHADHQERGRAMLADALEEIGASADQQGAILAIADSTHAQLEELHEGLEDHHAQMKAVLTAETVDRAAIEELRLEAVAGFDQASQLLAEALGDAAEQLSAEQRAELAEMAEEMHGG
jgi:Spy/CpxP family protein refolding chaperone